MSRGYDQYFKAVRKQRKMEGRPTATPSAAPRPKSKLTEDELRKAFNMKPPRRVRPPSMALIIPLIVGASIAAIGYFRPDLAESWLSAIEIMPLTQATAADNAPAEAAAPKDGETAKAAANESSPSAMECPPTSATSEEDLSHFSKLSERKKELDLREQELNRLEEELHNQRAEVEARIQKLESIRTEISTVLKDRVEIDQQRVNTLVEFYSNMKPKQAADIFKNLNEDLAVEVLGKMKKKNAAEIMNLLPPEKAKTLSEKFTGYRRR